MKFKRRCPFCDNRPKKTIHNPKLSVWNVKCDCCGTRGPNESSKKSAWYRWENRSPDEYLRTTVRHLLGEDDFGDDD